ncbi:MAG: hypothetical protein AAFY38_02590 [Pseudomonadota bacterium]
MSLAENHARDAAAEPRALRLPPVRGARAMRRLCLHMLGAGLIFAIGMLWIAPGAIWDANLVLIKLALSVLMGAAAWALLSAGRDGIAPAEVEVDLVRREVRVLHRGRGRDIIAKTCAFDALSGAECADGIIGLWGPDGAHLADVALRDRTAARLLTSALKDAGKL